MLMRWEDLEPGDIIKVTKSVRNRFEYSSWVHKNLTITKISCNIFGIINITCDEDLRFDLKLDGTHFGQQALGQFFEIVFLKED